jgi:carbonic anhydrase
MGGNIKQFLQEGNQRFLDQRLQKHPKLSQPQDANNLPMCAVVGCSDSRTCAEHIFSQSLGNFFSVRNAGHYVTNEVVASLEFAVSAGIKNIMIYGHTQCGAIQGALTHVLSPSTPMTPAVALLLDRFTSIIQKVMKENELQGEALVNACIEENVHQTKRDILEKSSYLRELHQKGEITVHSGLYKIETGKVHFFD